MSWKPWQVALIGGSSASLGLMLFFMLHKKKELDRAAHLMRVQLTSDVARGTYARQLEELRAHLAVRAEQIANQAADEHLASGYGLTPARMEGLRRLAQLFR